MLWKSQENVLESGILSSLKEPWLHFVWRKISHEKNGFLIWQLALDEVEGHYKFGYFFVMRMVQGWYWLLHRKMKENKNKSKVMNLQDGAVEYCDGEWGIFSTSGKKGLRLSERFKDVVQKKGWRHHYCFIGNALCLVNTASCN